MTSGHSGNAEPVCHRDVLRYCFLPQRQKKMPTGFESVGISVFLPEMLVPAEAERVSDEAVGRRSAAGDERRGDVERRDE